MSDKIEKMTDDDFKKIMQHLGMPESQSLYAALRQVENHTWQAAQSVPVVGGLFDLEKLESLGWQIAVCQMCGTHASAIKPAAELATLREKAETHALELRAYEATVQNLEGRIRQLEHELQNKQFEAQSVPEVIKQAISIAAIICDAIPGRLHEVSGDDWQRHIGRLVNERNNGRTGYDIIRDAEEMIASGTFQESAQSVPVVGEVTLPLAQLAYERAFGESEDIDFCLRIARNVAALIQPTNSIPSAELATLREKADEADELRECKSLLSEARESMRQYEADCDEYPPFRHNKLMERIDAAIAQGKGE